MPSQELEILTVQEAAPIDRNRIEVILKGTGVFSAGEIECALSLFDAYLRAEDNPDEYIFLCAYDSARNVLGFLCYGKASLTDCVYDLYWIATDRLFQGKGIASLLLNHLDLKLKQLRARMVIAETSSRADYVQSAHRLYMKNGFQQVAQIKDYYRLGDDLVIFQKRYP